MGQNWGKSKIAFVNLHKSNEQLFSADYNLKCAYMRAYLEQKGIGSVQYIQNNLTNMLDFVDDIFSLGNKYVAFYIDGSNYYLNNITARELKKSDDTIKIFWFGPAVGQYPDIIQSGDAVDVYIAFDEAESIEKLLSTPNEQWDEINGVFLKEKILSGDIQRFEGINKKVEHQPRMDDSISPYQNKIIPVEKAGNIGVMLMDGESYHSVERVISDLDYIAKGSKRDEVINLQSPGIEKYPDLTKLTNSIAKCAYPFKIKCTVGYNGIKKEIIEKLIKANFKVITFDIHENLDTAYLSSCMKWLKKLVESQGARFEFIINLAKTGASIESIIELIEAILNNKIAAIQDVTFIGSPAGQSPVRVPERFTYPQDLSNYIKALKGNDIYSSDQPLEYERALNNGLVAFLTGLYPEDALNNTVKHVSLEKDCLNAEVLERLKEFMGINGAIIIQDNDEKHNLEKADLYSEYGNILKTSNDMYDKYMKLAYDTGCYIPHLYEFSSSDTQYSKELVMDDFYRKNHLKLLVVPYSRIDSITEYENCFLSIESQADLDKFLENVDYFAETGSYKHQYEISCKILDGCRWATNKHCAFNKLPRMSIDNEGRILTCKGCSKSIGTVNDMYFKIMQNTSKISESEKISRGCNGCDVKGYCSKCVMLPDFINNENYCGIIKKRPIISNYIITAELLKYLTINTKHFFGATVKDIKISNRFFTQYFPKNIANENEDYTNSFVYMLTYKGAAVIFNVVTGRVMKINEPMAFLFEAWMKGISGSKLQTYMCEQFSIQCDVAANTIKGAFDLLRDAGCMRKVVEV